MNTGLRHLRLVAQPRPQNPDREALEEIAFEAWMLSMEGAALRLRAEKLLEKLEGKKQ
jgi:hypothetical protein